MCDARTRVFTKAFKYDIMKLDIKIPYKSKETNGAWLLKYARAGKNTHMKISVIIEKLNAKIICCDDDQLCEDVHSACGSDMMSDVLAYVKDQAVLLTGLVNTQVVRTAQMMDMKCIVFVRGKCPGDDIINMASAFGIVLLATDERMYTACGKLYESGLKGGLVE